MSTSWSFTSLQQFRNCPRQYHEVRVLKNFKEEEGEHLIWGNRVHAAFAQALEPQATPLPTGMEMWQPIVEQFRALKGQCRVENMLAVDKDFRPSGWRDWSNTWCRGIVDAMWLRDDGVAVAVDWKTGKRKPNSDQLALFALLIFAHHPEVRVVRSMFVWLKTAQKDREDFTRERIPELWQLFMTDLQRLDNCMTTDTWVPRTSGLCNFCPVSTCAYQGKRRNW
jgi:hypothetical protein